MVLLVTARRSGRWIIPKGWAERGLPPHRLAAREAFEEAGILGEAEEVPVGGYTYRKRMRDGRRAECRVTVFPLTVRGFAGRWPEQGQRRCRWASLEEAAALVAEPGLARLLRRLTEAPLGTPA